MSTEDPTTSKRLHQRGEDGYPVRADDVMQRAYGPIPAATEFQHRGGRATPAHVHGWQWSDDFGRWSALVTFPDGWHGFTYPVLQRDAGSPEEVQEERIAWAGAAVDTFMTQSGCDDDEVLGDLLTDLMHWADRHSYEFDAARCRAEAHYAAEKAGTEPRTFTTLIDATRRTIGKRGV